MRVLKLIKKSKPEELSFRPCYVLYAWTIGKRKPIKIPSLNVHHEEPETGLIRLIHTLQAMSKNVSVRRAIILKGGITVWDTNQVKK